MPTPSGTEPSDGVNGADHPMSPPAATPGPPHVIVSRDVDRAALLGAALAASVALTFGGQGAWDWLATGVGIALLIVLGAFFRLPHGPRPPGVLAEIAAVSAVAALAAALVVAAPLQAAISEFTDVGRGCHASAAVAAAVVLVDEQQQRGAALAVERLAGEGTTTTAAEALAQAAEGRHRDVLHNCLGAATTHVLWLPAAVAGLAVFAAVNWRMRRVQR